MNPNIQSLFTYFANRLLVFRVLVVGISLCLVFWTSVPLSADEPNIKDAGAGTIQGTVVYHADSKRPWRFARYYVKNSKTGLLAEAVVGLKDRQLETKNLQPKTVRIDQINFQFTPEVTAIQQGDSVKFTNSDGALHSVKTNDVFNAFDTTVANGDEYVHRFEKGLNFQPAVLECAFHGAMRAWVYVFNHPFFAVTQSDGAFQLTGVPPGTYELRMVHPAGKLVWKQSVTVKSGETINFTIDVSPEDQIE